MRALFIASVALLVGCSQVAPTVPAPCPKPVITPGNATVLTPAQIENDQVCRSMYGLPCNALTHMIGPMTAELRKEARACVGETISVYVSGKWVADNKYQNPNTGERYGDHCIAVSL
jgi:hypothetical protein